MAPAEKAGDNVSLIKGMSKANLIFLISIIGIYAALCLTLFVRGCAQYFGGGGHVARKEIGRVSSAVGFTPRRLAWTRAVWRGNPAH